MNPTKKPFYIQQFIICRSCRGEGYGKLAFMKLLDTVETVNIDIECIGIQKVIHFGNHLDLKKEVFI